MIIQSDIVINYLTCLMLVSSFFCFVPLVAHYTVQLTMAGYYYLGNNGLKQTRKYLCGH